MTVSTWTPSDTAKAEHIWSEYQKKHDLSGDVGRTAGIDPTSGRVWIGESILDVVSKRNADGIDAPLFFDRVGSSTYYRKQRRHLPPVLLVD